VASSLLNPSGSADDPVGMSAMDHRYIDEFSVAARYIDKALTARERAAFESHMVDCQECTDRILLAEIFHTREPNEAPPHLPPHAQLAAHLAPWQLLVLFLIAAVLLLAIPTLLIPILLR
jgi:hypothetical protein